MPLLACSFCLECLSKHASVALYCGHTFHESCLRRWFAGNGPFHHGVTSSRKCCPACREIVKFNSGRIGIKLFFHVDDETTELENRILELENRILQLNAELENSKRNEASIESVLSEMKVDNVYLRSTAFFMREDLKSEEIKNEYLNVKLKTCNAAILKAKDRLLKEFEQLSSECRTLTDYSKLLNTKIPADMEGHDKPVLCEYVMELREKLEGTSRTMIDILKAMNAVLLQENKEEEEEVKRSQHSKRKSSNPDNSSRKKRKCHPGW